MSSRHSDRQRHSGEDLNRSQRSSHSSKRSEDSVKRRERDRDYDRRKDSRREKSVDRKYASNEKQDSRKSKASRSRSKADRTYNTDTEESDESSESPTRDLKRRLSSDHEDEVRDAKLQSDEKRKNHLAQRTPTHGVSMSCDEESKEVRTIRKVTGSNQVGNARVLSTESAPLSIGPVRPPHLQGKDTESEDELNIGPTLLPHGKEKDSDSEDVSKSIGPVLPPHLQRKTSPVREEELTIGPVLPPHLQKKESGSEDESIAVGPVLPPHLQRKRSTETNSADELESAPEGSSKSTDDTAALFGPALPPGLKTASSRTLGPCLPPGMELPSAESRGNDSGDSDEEIVGPMLPEELIQSNKNYLVHAELERRAAEVKRQMEGKESDTEASKREKWMLELPPEGTIDLGLGPRTFRIKGAPEKGADRSIWTDTPADKLRKQTQAINDAQNEGPSSNAALIPPEVSLRDKEMEKIVKKHSKKRGKDSLLDLHQKELNKKKKKDKEDGKKEERRPFSREVDLKTNVFDEAQKKSIFKKAQLLDTRFSRGETKYL